MVNEMQCLVRIPTVLAVSFALCLSSCVTAPKTDGSSSPQALNQYANRLDDSGRSLEALRYYEAAIPLFRPEEASDRASCLYDYGLALRRLGRLDEAIAAYRQSLQLDPTQERIYVNLGLALDRARRGAEAQEVYTSGLERFPGSLYLIENMAVLLIGMKRPEEAVPFVKRAIAIRESHPGLADNPRYLPRWRAFLAKPL